jgi:hypothetical protein
MINAVWAISFGIELALILRLIRWRVDLPVFRSYLIFDLIRSVLLWTFDDGTQSSRPYLYAWKYTEPIAIVLLAMVGAESWKKLVNSPIRYLEVWVAVSLAPLAVGITSGGPKFRLLLFGHAFVTALIAAGLCVCLSGEWRTHAGILAAFCCVEFVGHAAILAGTVCDSRIAAAVIIGETACLAAWLWHAIGLTASGGIARLRM